MEGRFPITSRPLPGRYRIRGYETPPRPSTPYPSSTLFSNRNVTLANNTSFGEEMDLDDNTPMLHGHNRGQTVPLPNPLRAHPVTAEDQMIIEASNRRNSASVESSPLYGMNGRDQSGSNDTTRFQQWLNTAHSSTKQDDFFHRWLQQGSGSANPGISMNPIPFRDTMIPQEYLPRSMATPTLLPGSMGIPDESLLPYWTSKGNKKRTAVSKTR
jgi:hypothetical protein